MYAFDKTFGMFLGLVLEQFPDRVKVDRSWLYGTEEKKLQYNHFTLQDVDFKELTPEELLIEQNKIKAIWDTSYARVMAIREEWIKTWIVH